MKKPKTVSLITPFEKELKNTDTPLSEYPRPQLVRDSYICLNGNWDFKIINTKNNITEFDGKITVPFPPESRISGVEREIKKNDRMVYSIDFSLPDGFLKDRLILHFGAVDQYATVYINDREIGKNVGGYLPFSFDITDYIMRIGVNKLSLAVYDPLDKNLPYGKQTDKRGGMWYTKISGIWQTVWLESVTDDYIKALKITPTLNSVNIEIYSNCAQKTIVLEMPDGNKEYTVTGDSIDIEIENPQLWSPESPYLYNFTVISGKDTVKSYFALREISVKAVNGKKYICLNGKPYYFHGLLDQGYFSDGIYTPASYEAYKNDILKMKSCGFNMLRKHIKTEPQLFYYYCDKYGMAVFQDFINSGKYSFLIDTALPTVFSKKGIEHSASKIRRERFFEMGNGIIDYLYNHPSVCYYTIFNEGWGQFGADNCYTHFKSLEPTRIFDTASGWFENKLSDVQSEHVYFKPVRLKAKKCKPLVLSEFGGYSCKIKDHSFNTKKTYGYRYFKDKIKFQNALLKLYSDEILPMVKAGLNATVLTQVSDVEDETNGLLTYDRRVLKVEPNALLDTSIQLKEAFNETISDANP